MIAHAFPPEGGAGTYRPLRFARGLAQRGWHPAVLSLATDTYSRYDPHLLSLIPPEVSVIRVPNRDPWRQVQQWRAQRATRQLSITSPGDDGQTPRQSSLRSWARGIVRRVEAVCYRPDPDMGWIRPAVNTGLKLCAQDRPCVIWATAGPVSSFVVAQQLSRSTGVPYVLDFRDSWTITFNEFEDNRPAWAKRAAERSMSHLLQGASAVILRWRAEAECYWRAYPGALQPTKVHLIPNGYDGSIQAYEPPTGRTTCEILYTGTLPDYRYDTLLRALAVMRRVSPDVASRLHFSFVGEGTEAVADAAVALGLSDMVTTRGAVAQEQLSGLIKQAHAMLILGRAPTMRGYELFAGAKLFGYLKTGLPIIGVLPQDETRNVLQSVRATTIADVECEADIMRLLETVVDAWSRGTLSDLVPNRDECAAYSAERQTGDLIRALEGLPPNAPYLPGSTPVPPSLRSELRRRSSYE